MEPDKLPKIIPKFFNVHKITTPNFVVNRYPKMDREIMLADLCHVDFFPGFTLNIAALEYSAMRRISPAYAQPVVRIEFDMIMDEKGEFKYSVRNAMKQEYVAPVSSHKFTLFFKIPDLSTWPKEKVEEYRAQLLERQAKIAENQSYTAGEAPFSEPERKQNNLFPIDEDREDLMYEVIDALCDAPWCPRVNQKARDFLKEEGRLFTGTPSKMGEAGDFVKRAFVELKATDRFERLEDLERRMIDEFIGTDYEATQKLLYDRTVKWHRNNMLLLIKNNVYLNGKGEEVDWSEF